jgi:hypothetical protein
VQPQRDSRKFRAKCRKAGYGILFDVFIKRGAHDHAARQHGRRNIKHVGIVGTMGDREKRLS